MPKDTEKFEFIGYDIFLKTLKSNKDSFRVEIETGKDQYNALKEIPNMPQGLYKVIIEPIIE